MTEIVVAIGSKTRIGAALREARLMRPDHPTIEAVAAQAQMERATLSRYESGDRLPTTDTLSHLATFLPALDLDSARAALSADLLARHNGKEESMPHYAHG